MPIKNIHTNPKYRHKPPFILKNNLIKKYTYELENIQDSFFVPTLFKYLKKHTYESEKPETNFYSYSFQLSFLKKHTYESENT